MTLIGTKFTEEHKRKLSKARLGNKNPFYGKKHTRAARNKISLSLIGNTRGFKKGQKFTKEHLQKLSNAKKGKKPWNKDMKTPEIVKNKIRGDKNFNWKGGISKLPNYFSLSQIKRLETKAGRKKPKECELCGKEGRICYDHNHVDGRFRGWICIRCNTLVGYIEKTPELLLKKLQIYITSK